MEEFLWELVEYVNCFRISDEIKSFSAKKKIQEEYKKKIEENSIDGFLSDITDSLSDDPELYCLVMSALFSIVKDKRITIHLLELLSTGILDYFTGSSIWEQIGYAMSEYLDTGYGYPLQRKVFHTLKQQLGSMLDLNYTYIPFKDRDKKRVLVVTNQLLDDSQAPNRMITETCKTLQERFGYEVLLLVIYEKNTVDRMNQYWIDPQIVKKMEELNGRFTLDADGENIKGYQIGVSSNNVEEIKWLMDQTHALRPLFAWYMGGNSAYSDIFAFTTGITMPIADGYVVSELPYMLTGIMPGSFDRKEAESFLENEGQHPISIHLQDGEPEPEIGFVNNIFDILMEIGEFENVDFCPEI